MFQPLIKKLNTTINFGLDIAKEFIDLSDLNNNIPEGDLDTPLLKQLANLAFNGTNVALVTVIPDEDQEQQESDTHGLFIGMMVFMSLFLFVFCLLPNIYACYTHYKGQSVKIPTKLHEYILQQEKPEIAKPEFKTSKIRSSLAVLER